MQKGVWACIDVEIKSDRRYLGFTYLIIFSLQMMFWIYTFANFRIVIMVAQKST